MFIIERTVEGHNCKEDTESESYEYDDHFGDFVEFKKELKTNVSFLVEVSKTWGDIWSFSKILNFDIELILESLASFKSKTLKNDSHRCSRSYSSAKVHYEAYQIDRHSFFGHSIAHRPALIKPSGDETNKIDTRCVYSIGNRTTY